MMYLCQFGLNLTIDSEDRVEYSQGFFIEFMSLVILKIRSRSPKSNVLLKYSLSSISASLVESYHWFRR